MTDNEFLKYILESVDKKSMSSMLEIANSFIDGSYDFETFLLNIQDNLFNQCHRREILNITSKTLKKIKSEKVKYYTQYLIDEYFINLWRISRYGT